MQVPVSVTPFLRIIDQMFRSDWILSSCQGVWQCTRLENCRQRTKPQLYSPFVELNRRMRDLGVVGVVSYKSLLCTQATAICLTVVNPQLLRQCKFVQVKGVVLCSH